VSILYVNAWHWHATDTELGVYVYDTQGFRERESKQSYKPSG